MPLLLEQKTSTGNLYIWNFNESIKELEQKYSLHNSEIDKYNKFKNERRKKEFLASRLIMQEKAPELLPIHYTEEGAPLSSKQDSHVSISHSGTLACLIESDNSKVAVDIEKRTDRITRIQSKFIHPEEAIFLTSENLNKQLYVIWGAKECLYKILNRKNVIFNENLKVERFTINEQGKIKAYVLFEDLKKEYQLFYKHINDYTLVWIEEE